MRHRRQQSSDARFSYATVQGCFVRSPVDIFARLDDIWYIRLGYDYCPEIFTTFTEHIEADRRRVTWNDVRLCDCIAEH
jgi:hypothetical protein